jgi:hypothetical protein
MDVLLSVESGAGCGASVGVFSVGRDCAGIGGGDVFVEATLELDLPMGVLT